MPIYVCLTGETIRQHSGSQEEREKVGERLRQLLCGREITKRITQIDKFAGQLSFKVDNGRRARENFSQVFCRKSFDKN